MKISIKILLLVLASLVTNVNVVNASIPFPNIQKTTTFFSFHKEIPKTVVKAIEDDLGNYCLNKNNLLAYRNWGIGVEANAAKTVGSGAQYSVAYEMKLASSSYPGVYRGAHFLEANKALSATMATDARFASSMSQLGINIPRSPAGSILGKSPANWVWHHDVGARLCS